MADSITEIRWHARAGQGAVTAAKLTAEAALEQGKHFQAFPEYGPERTGAPIQAFVRLSDEPIRIHSNVEHPDVVVVLDPTLLGMVDVTHGLKEGGVLLINTDKPAGEVRREHGFSNGCTVYSVDASKIAKDAIGKDIPNTPMVGALVRATGLLKLDDVLSHIREEFGKKFPQPVIDGNVEAIRRAHEEVQGE